MTTKSIPVLSVLGALACILTSPNLHADELTDKPPKARFVQHLDTGKKQTIVTFGTSLTAIGAWVDQLATVLEQTYPGQATVINGAQGGANSDWGVKSLEQKVLSHQPDTVLIEFAVNDAVSKRRTNVEHARTNLEQIISRILKANPHAEIILQVMNVPVGHTRTGRPNLDAYNQMYRDVAKERGYRLIDHWPNWQTLLEEDPLRFVAFVPDTIHPVRTGALAIITPHLLRELGLPAGHPETSTATPCWNYLLHIMRTDKTNPATTREDFAGYWEKLFDLADINRDDGLSLEELATDSLLTALDKNQNGRIERQEWLTAYKGLFEPFDRNQDGSLSPEEKQSLTADVR